MGELAMTSFKRPTFRAIVFGGALLATAAARPADALVLPGDGSAFNALGAGFSVNGVEAIFILDNTLTENFIFDDSIGDLGLALEGVGNMGLLFPSADAPVSEGALALTGLPDATTEFAVTDAVDVGIGDGVASPSLFGDFALDSVNGEVEINPTFDLVFDSNDSAYVEVTLKGETGEKKVLLKLDTGAAISTILPDVAKEVGLKDTGKNAKVSGAVGGSKTTDIYKGEIDDIGEDTFVALERKVKEVDGKKVVGLLGTNFLDRRYKLDTRTGKLEVFDENDKMSLKKTASVEELSLSVVPLPASALLLASALAGLGWASARRTV